MNNSIGFLWELQNLEEDLGKIEKKVNLIVIRDRLKLLKADYEELRKRLKNKIEKLKEVENKLIRKNLKNKNLNYEIKELQDKIYNGSVSRSIVLSKLQKDLKDYRAEVDDLENEILEKMEMKEVIEKDIKDLRRRAIKIQDKYKKEKGKYNIEEENIQSEKDKLTRKINNIKGKIDEKYILDYRNLEKSIKNPISLIDKGLCTGCNMNISIILLNDIKESPGFYTCENCGRILYMK